MPDGPSQEKIYVLDTSVLVYDPDAINLLDKNILILPIPVLYELDGLKIREGNVGFSAREAIRVIEELTNNGLSAEVIRAGVATKGGGKMFFVPFHEDDWKYLSDGIDRKTDARIMAIARKTVLDNPGKKVILLTQDSAFLLIARAEGIDAERYHKNCKITDSGELYTGRAKLVLPTQDTAILTLLHVRSLEYDELKDSAGGTLPELFPNQCLEIWVEHKCELAMFREEKFFLIPKYLSAEDTKRIAGRKSSSLMPILPPKNLEQAMAFTLAMRPDLDIITFSGRPGSGKTFMAVQAAYILTRHRDDMKVKVFRPTVGVGEDLGFMPGDIEQKMSPWMQPIVEIFCQLDMAANGCPYTESVQTLEDMIINKMWAFSPILHIRGATFNNTVIIIDECQNLSPHEILSLITRAGENSRVIITGDPTQIDSRFLNRFNNGLVMTGEKFKGDPIAGHLTFTKSVRSRLAERASELLS